jgi:hypothetical protein
LHLQKFNYVIYRKGKLHKDAGILSRYVDDPLETIEDNGHCLLFCGKFLGADTKAQEIEMLNIADESSDLSSTELESDNIFEILNEPVEQFTDSQFIICLSMTETYYYESVFKNSKAADPDSEQTTPHESPRSVITPPSS